MNKKRLSVVMAGAMLASSVAPVLAAVEKQEISSNETGLLVDQLDGLFESKKFDVNDRNIVSGVDQGSSAFAGKSVYRIEIYDINGNVIKSNADSTTVTGKYLFENTIALKTALNANNVSKVKVFELGNRTDDKGRIVSTGLKAGVEGTVQYYTEDELKALVEDAKKTTSATTAGLAARFTDGTVKSIEQADDKKVIVTLSSVDEKYNNNIITLEVGSPELDFTKPVDKNGVSVLGNVNILSEIANFASVVSGEEAAGTAINSVAVAEMKQVKEFTIASGDTILDLNDLYDGFMLTEKGHDLLDKYVSYNKKGRASKVLNTSGVVKTLTITLNDKDGNVVEKIVVKSTNQNRITKLNEWLTAGHASVDIIAGSNRYETAVKIAKTYINKGQYQNIVSGSGMSAPKEFVLVNGRALVDGLAASPYSHRKGAPILLTEADKLPKETKKFLKEYVSNEIVGELKDITITIIGGEAVVSQNVVEELKDLGFKVKRLYGDNREETSLEVAEELGKDKAFVVGANGEADAMSIAAYASSKDYPIIVAKSAKGLSSLALSEIANFKEVEIVGGELAISKADEEKIADSISNEENVSRINGKNRFETNALVIKKYHHNFENVLVTKDGKSSKDELVDALPASLFASTVGGPAAPIVLATNKLSNEQLNNLVLNSKLASSNGTVYQIGHGVNPETVMHVIVTKLGLNK